MAKALVSIISEQLIPNYHLYILLKDKIQRHVLITTSKMNDLGYTNNFRNLIGKDQNVDFLILDDFKDFDKIINNLSKENSNDEYFVNITGGTKVMSLAVFNHFSKLNSSIYYVAIGTNSCQKIYPKQEAPIKFNHQLSLKDYLSLYGFIIEKSNSLFKTANKTNKLFEKVKKSNYNSLSVYDIRDAFGDNKKLLKKDELDYLKGLWFEEYIYSIIKEKLNLKDFQIALNVKVKRDSKQQTNDNEFDVMFVKNNKLYIVECKSSIGIKKDQKKNLESYLYKLAAAVKDMGLQVNPILAIVGNAEKHKSIVKRSEILKTHIIDSNKFENVMMFDIFIKLL